MHILVGQLVERHCAYFWDKIKESQIYIKRDGGTPNQSAELIKLKFVV